MRYSTVLLDLDHTLFDTDASERAAFESTMRSAGIDDPGHLLATYVEINTALWSAVERHEITPDEVRVVRFEQLVAVVGLDADPRRLADDFVIGLGANGDLYPGARRVLEALADRTTLALVTNGLSEVQRARVERLDISRYFDAIVISAEIGWSKPHVTFFDVTFESLGSPEKQSTVMVGDSLSADIRGGADYGLATCWYNPHRRAPDPAAGFDHEIASLEELPAIVFARRYSD